ncbi:MAG: FIST N-terminal domain-containing protein [Desulfobacteraceae bacterium]
MMKVGIAYITESDAHKSGQSVARAAMAEGGIAQADLVVAFCTSAVNHQAFYKGLREVVGDVPPIIGGSAIGVITHNGLSYEGTSAGVMIIESEGVAFDVQSVGDLQRDAETTGRSLAEQLDKDLAARLLLIFYDSIRRPASSDNPPIMNPSPPLIKGIESAHPEEIPIYGAGLLGGFDFSPTYQFCGHHIAQQSVVGLSISGDIRLYARIMHGCTPQDGIYHTITRSEGAVVYEVDERPIVDWIDEMYGHQEWQHQMPVKRLTIGVNHGEKFGEFNENNFVNRLIAGVLPNRDGIILFEPDLSEGTEVLFMLRDADAMIRSAKSNTTELIEEITADGAHPLVAFYMDCAGRASHYSETLTEEADQVIAGLNKHNIPLFGFYSGVEVAPLMGKSRGLDWTSVLLILAD